MTCLSKHCVKKSRPKNILIGETSFHFLIEGGKMILRIFHALLAHFYLGTYLVNARCVCALNFPTFFIAIYMPKVEE